MRRLPTIIALGLLAVGCGAEPQPAPPTAPPEAPATPGSAEAVAATLIARLDADGDGRLSRTEHQRYAAPEPSFDELDRDGDGQLNRTELLLAIASNDPGFNSRWND